MNQHPASRVYAFAGFTLDARRRLLLSRPDGQIVPLPSTAFDTLLYLVEHAGELVEKQTLMRAVWPRINVEENSLSQSISIIRRALGEAPSDHRFVVTVQGRGFRFIAKVTTEGADGRHAESAMASADPNAIQLYVAGWWALTRPTGGNLQGALQQLEQAVALDPNFALAHVCIGDCYSMLGVHAQRRPHEVFPKARDAVLRALEIDGDLPEAHAELGLILSIYDFDWKGAELALGRALEINPRCFLAHRYQGNLFLARGEFDAALASFRRAQSIEPLAVATNGNIGTVYYFSGRYDEAVVQFETTLRMDAGFDVARTFLGRSFLRLGEFERAIEQFEARTSTTAASAADLAATYALSGRLDEAKEELEGLLQERERRYVSAFDFATIHAALGNDDAALDALERAFEERSIPFVMVDPAFHRLHGQPRFTRLLERLGIAKHAAMRTAALRAEP
jgi:DNA-binding winged helix-turn-helix (wHTH) protein/Tfp pilus assembly protein PilF